MTEHVTVTVSGLTGSGKSAIYGEIVLALEAIGIDVAHESERAWQSECSMTHADWQTALDLYQPTVMMVEKNISRKPKNVRQDRTIWERIKMFLSLAKTESV